MRGPSFGPPVSPPGASQSLRMGLLLLCLLLARIRPAVTKRMSSSSNENPQVFSGFNPARNGDLGVIQDGSSFVPLSPPSPQSET